MKESCRGNIEAFFAGIGLFCVVLVTEGDITENGVDYACRAAWLQTCDDNHQLVFLARETVMGFDERNLSAVESLARITLDPQLEPGVITVNSKAFSFNSISDLIVMALNDIRTNRS